MTTESGAYGLFQCLASHERDRLAAQYAITIAEGESVDDPSAGDPTIHRDDLIRWFRIVGRHNTHTVTDQHGHDGGAMPALEANRTLCWADVWRGRDEEDGDYGTCNVTPDPSSTLGLCTEHLEKLRCPGS